MGKERRRMSAEIVNRQTRVDIAPALEKKVKEAVEIALKLTMGHDDFEVDVSFVDDDEIERLNAAYRGVQAPTDVLSFPMDDPDELVAYEGDCAELTECPDLPNIVPVDDFDVWDGEDASSAADAIGAANCRLLGDVVISLPRAVEQAADYGHSLAREVCYLAVHGVLHLVGHDHETDEDASQMREIEESVMCRIGLPR